MPRRPVTKEEGEMLMRLALAMADELTEDQMRRAVTRWSEHGELDDAEFKALIARVDNARRELGPPRKRTSTFREPM